MKKQQNLFRLTNQEWLAGARKHAQEMLMTRYSITIMDVLEKCPYPSYLGKRKNIAGQVFQNEDVFQAIGYTKSRLPGAKQHVIRVWTLNEGLYAESQLRFRRRDVEEVEDVA